MIYNNLHQLIGNTPMLNMEGFCRAYGLETPVIAKIESFNPLGSAKDRPALYMIEAAERSGALRPGMTIVEPTSGNTGIGLAYIGRKKGYRVVLVMPDSMSAERRMLLAALGAELVLTPGAEGMSASVRRAKELCAAENGFMPDQFSNPANALAHYETTGPEIWRDTEGCVDVFVATVGTGGTITGVGRYLREQNPNVHIVAVEPADSPVLSGGKPGPHKLQGIGAGYIPAVLDTGVYDEVITATTQQAFDAARTAAREDGLLCGISSGASLYAASELAKRPEYRGKRIVALLTDTGERYLSSGLYE